MILFFFFFKQKTAYEMRISDWSSDVCSSDLGGVGQFFERPFHPPFGHALAGMLAGIKPHLRVAASHFNAVDRLTFEAGAQAAVRDPVTLGDRSDQVVVPFHRIGREIGDPQIGRASCRERVCQYVYISVVAGSLKTKKNNKTNKR